MRVCPGDAGGIGGSVWSSREPSSIGEGMETLSIAPQIAVAQATQRWVDFEIQIVREI